MVARCFRVVMLEAFSLDPVSLNIFPKRSFGSAFRCRKDSVDLFHMTIIGFCFVVCARLFVTETHFLKENPIDLNACAGYVGFFATESTQRCRAGVLAHGRETSYPCISVSSVAKNVVWSEYRLSVLRPGNAVSPRMARRATSAIIRVKRV